MQGSFNKSKNESPDDLFYLIDPASLASSASGQRIWQNLRWKCVIIDELRSLEVYQSIEAVIVAMLESYREGLERQG